MHPVRDGRSHSAHCMPSRALESGQLVPHQGNKGCFQPLLSREQTQHHSSIVPCDIVCATVQRQVHAPTVAASIRWASMAADARVCQCACCNRTVHGSHFCHPALCAVWTHQRMAACSSHLSMAAGRTRSAEAWRAPTASTVSRP